MTAIVSPKAETDRVRYLDGWRGFAILAVLFAHFITTKYLNFGRFGVELFFVLSGRLMAEILFTKAVPLSQFFPRRFTRIYPALFIFLTVMLLLSVLFGIGKVRVPDYLASITFTLNYAQLYIGRPGVIGHIWSLCIEEHVYIVLGTLAYFHRKRPLPLVPVLTALILIAATIGAVQTVLGYDYYSVYWRTDVRGASILIGALAYLIASERGIARVAWPVPVVCCAAAVLLNLDAVPDPVKYTIGTALLAIGLVTMPQAPRWILAVVQSPLAVRFGILSYSLYLWQQPFAKLAGGTIERLAVLPLVLLVTLISYYAVERPLREQLNRLVDRYRQRRATSG